MLLSFTKKTVQLLSYFCMIAILGLTVIVATQVTARFFSISTPWAEELARFFLVWLTFLGSSLAIHEKLHLSVNYFVNMAPRRMRTGIGLLIYGLMITFFSILIVYGFRLSILSMNTSSSTLQWPMGLVYSVIPLSSILCIYFIIIRIMGFMRGGDVKL